MVWRESALIRLWLHDLGWHVDVVAVLILRESLLHWWLLDVDILSDVLVIIIVDGVVTVEEVVGSLLRWLLEPTHTGVKVVLRRHLVMEVRLVEGWAFVTHV